MAHGCTYCTDDFHCEKFTNEKCTSWCYGEGYPCKERRISNADRIRGMSDEELAKWISDVSITDGFCPYGNTRELCITHNFECVPCITYWLKEEVRDD